MFGHPDLHRHATKYYGKYSGEVTANTGVGTVGNVRVRVPAIYGPHMDVVARPCLPFAHFFVPAVGAHVWVEFEAGDPAYPIWVGVWYTSNDAPSPAAVSPPDNRVIQTPSGHTIEIDDKGGDERITIHHKDGSLVELKNGTARIHASTVVLDASNVTVGSNASEPAVLGNSFSSMWNAFALHTHPTALGPSGPPTPPAQMLSPGNGLSAATKVK